MSKRVEVGYVARAHGVRGELRVVLHNPESRAFDTTRQVVVGGTAYDLIRARAVDGAVLLLVGGVGDRNAADALRGATIEVDRDELALDDDQVLLSDLVGLAVELPDGSPWGEVVAVEPGPQDRLIIHDGQLERLLPVVDALIVDIDVDGGRIVVDPPEGWPESPRER